MHIQAVMETVPYFDFVLNYSRYTPVYIAEMKQLEEREPLMYRHMMEGGWQQGKPSELYLAVHLGVCN